MPGLLTVEQIRESPTGFVGFDTAALNLSCAVGLPGAENLNISDCLATLDRWSEYAKQETDRCYHQFLRNPADFENSQGFYCVLALVTALQRDLGVQYNPAKILDPTFQDPNPFEADFSDSRDIFIHGVINGPGGTCASMPIVCVAVGRRLGYPLKLVHSPGHLFARWDDPSGSFNGVPDRFNIECTGKGFACHPDEHYRHWPREWLPQEIEADCYLTSLSPEQELAQWLVDRALCLESNDLLDDAIRFYKAALVLSPNDRRYQWAMFNAHSKRCQLMSDLAQAAFQSARQQSKLDVQKSQHHAAACGCWDCLNQKVMNHGPSCQCFHCRNSKRSPSHV